jgi:hypothetical protein
MAAFNPQASVKANAARFLEPRLAPRFVSGLPGLRGRVATLTDISGHRPPAPVPVAGIASAQVLQRRGGGVTLRTRLSSNYAATLDDSGINQIAERMTQQMRDMSRGQWSLKAIAAAGHFYGRDKGGIGRRLPGRGRHVIGVHGSVPSLTVINEQTGQLLRSWDYSVTRDAAGVTIEIFNTAPESWFVTAGTIKMQAHSPVVFVMQMFRGTLMTEWRREASAAYHRQKAQAALSATLGTL